jgi:transposase InsO family protein
MKADHGCRAGRGCADDGGLAIWRRGKADALLHHLDQGSQYTSERFQRLLLDNGITCSMSEPENFGIAQR